MVSYLLVENDQAVLIDTGFVGYLRAISKALGAVNLGWRSIEATLLTHGHLDHTLNAAMLKKLSGAPVHAHSCEDLHIMGRYAYRGMSRVCGCMEAAGRAVFQYRPVAVDRTMEDGDELPFWGGLRVVHLPGHTRGHCGFYSQRHDLLFTGDLFATERTRTVLPPAIFNTEPERFQESIEKVMALNPLGLLANHCDTAPPEVQKRRFDEFAKKTVPFAIKPVRDGSA